MKSNLSKIRLHLRARGAWPRYGSNFRTAFYLYLLDLFSGYFKARTAGSVSELIRGSMIHSDTEYFQPIQLYCAIRAGCTVKFLKE